MTKFIFRLFLFVLIFSPLAFGTVEQWSLTVMETSSFLAFFLFCARNLRRKTNFFYEVPGLVPLLFFLGYFILQLAPLPPDVIKIISPETYSVYKETVWIDGAVRWAALSLNKKATLLEFFRTASYAIFYILTVQLLTSKDLMKKTISAVIIFASVLSVLGILQHVFSNNKIYWIRELTQGGTPFGPYVNRNHYAGLMGMIFPLALGLFLFYKPDIRYGSFRDRISEIFNQRVTNVHVLLGFSSVLIATSVFLSLSRGGIISLSLSMIFFGLMISGKVRNKKRGIAIILIFIVILYSVGWFGWNPIFERFGELRKDLDISSERPRIWNDSVNIIKDFPITGTGFGSFVNIYPKYRSISLEATIDHAHNDYIELFTDGGIVAILLFGCFSITIFYKSYRAFMKRREPYSIYAFIGLASGMLSILIHSISDFNLHIGANGLYFSFLAGLAVSAANTRFHAGLNSTFLQTIKPRGMKLLVFLAGLILALSLIFNIGVLVGKLYFSFIKDGRLEASSSGGELLRYRDIARNASIFDPLEQSYHYNMANVEWLLSNKAAALKEYEETVRLNPVDGEHIQTLGLVMADLKKSDVADSLLKKGISCDVSNPGMYKRYASWLMAKGKKDDGIMNIRKAISLEPKKTREYITIMVLYGLGDREIRNSLPEMAEPHLLLADYLYKTGKEDEAWEEYLNALDYANKEKEVSPSYFYQVYQYCMKKNMYDNALMVINKALNIWPDNVELRLTAAETYEKAGITYRAVEEYRKALIIDPKNIKAGRKLHEIR